MWENGGKGKVCLASKEKKRRSLLKESNATIEPEEPGRPYQSVSQVGQGGGINFRSGWFTVGMAETTHEGQRAGRRKSDLEFIAWARIVNKLDKELGQREEQSQGVMWWGKHPNSKSLWHWCRGPLGRRSRAEIGNGVLKVPHNQLTHICLGNKGLLLLRCRLTVFSCQLPPASFMNIVISLFFFFWRREDLLWVLDSFCKMGVFGIDDHSFPVLWSWESVSLTSSCYSSWLFNHSDNPLHIFSTGGRGRHH